MWVHVVLLHRDSLIRMGQEQNNGRVMHWDLPLSKPDYYIFPLVCKMLWWNSCSWRPHGHWLTTDPGTWGPNSFSDTLKSVYMRPALLHPFVISTGFWQCLLSCATVIHLMGNSAVCLLMTCINFPLRGNFPPMVELGWLSATAAAAALYFWEQSTPGSINLWDLVNSQVELSYPGALLQAR